MATNPEPPPRSVSAARSFSGVCAASDSTPSLAQRDLTGSSPGDTDKVCHPLRHLSTHRGVIDRDDLEVDDPEQRDASEPCGQHGPNPEDRGTLSRRCALSTSTVRKRTVASAIPHSAQ